MDLPDAAFLLSRKQTKHFNPPEHSHPNAGQQKGHIDKPHKSPPENDLAERPQKAGANDAQDDDRKSSKSSAKGKYKSNSKGKPSKATEINAEAVPVPAPDTGMPVTAIHPGILPVIAAHGPTTLTVPPTSFTSGFSPLPSLTALATSATLSGMAVPSGTPADLSRTVGAAHADQAGGKAAKRLPVVLIVLVTVGIGFLALGALIICRARMRPRQRSCPRPSQPIFQDPFADEEKEVKVDDESLFGGKERASAVARPNSNGLWTWTQYTPKPSSQALGTGTGALTAYLAFPEPPKVVPVAPSSEKSVPPSIQIPLPPLPPPATPNPPLQQMQSALSRAANRVSALSMSIYPTSPQSTSGIGLAIGSQSPLTADGTPVLQRKPSAKRLSSKSRQSMRHSVAATEYLDADIYGGAYIASPFTQSPRAPPPPPLPTSLPKPALRKSTSISAHGQSQGVGRARVKGPYTPGSGAAGLRSSSTVAGIATLARGNRSSVMAPSSETQYVLPPLSPALKSPARRERDTRALASAMGLASPEPPSAEYVLSPQPTLYPDDSITLAGDRQRARRPSVAASHARAQSEAQAMSPGTEASARLGNLMLAEFTSMASLPSTRTVAHTAGGAAGAGAGQGGVPASGSKARVVPRKNVRADDRPPRVPSPPPLPSLAQMALAHANPEEYADYRSPTYSIYGLYEAERKSRMPSEAAF